MSTFPVSKNEFNGLSRCPTAWHGVYDLVQRYRDEAGASWAWQDVVAGSDPSGQNGIDTRLETGSDRVSTHEITVYSRAGCHLCADAIAAIRQVAAETDVTVSFEVVDVDETADLTATYGERVPYVLVDGRPRFKFHVDKDELRSILSAGD